MLQVASSTSVVDVMVAVTSSSGLIKLMQTEEEEEEEEEEGTSGTPLLITLCTHHHYHSGKDKRDKIFHLGPRDQREGCRVEETLLYVAVDSRPYSVLCRRKVPTKGGSSTPVPSPEKNSVGFLSGRMMSQRHMFIVIVWTPEEGEGEEEEGEEERQEIGRNLPFKRRELRPHAVCVEKWDTQNGPVPRQGATESN